MAVIQTFAMADLSTLANFKAWAQIISNAIASFGWTQSADSGQVNWSSIATVPTANTWVYEIWKSADTLSATNPIFLKIEYGNVSATPSIAVTVGSGSNGTGTLTNAATRNLLTITLPANSTTTLFECDLSGSTSRFAFTMWRGLPLPTFFSVERSHDTNGNETGSYVTYLNAGTALLTPFCYQQSIYPSSAGGPLFYEKFGMTFHTANASSVNVGNAIVAVPFWPLVGKIDNPLLGAVCVKDADIADGLIFTVNIYSAIHTYIVTKTSALWGDNAANAIAMRYE